MEWTPLQDHWDAYEEKLEEALEEGLLDDPTTAQELIFPSQLHLGEGEKDDVREFVSERLNEIFSAYQHNGNFNVDLIGTYLFRAILMGMEWEDERIGR